MHGMEKVVWGIEHDDVSKMWGNTNIDILIQSCFYIVLHFILILVALKFHSSHTYLLRLLP